MIPFHQLTNYNSWWDFEFYWIFGLLRVSIENYHVNDALREKIESKHGKLSWKWACPILKCSANYKVNIRKSWYTGTEIYLSISLKSRVPVSLRTRVGLRHGRFASQVTDTESPHRLFSGQGISCMHV